MSGHIFFKERWYGFDDGTYAGCRLLEILSRHANPSALHQGGISPLEKNQPHWAHHPSSRPARFDIAVLLSPLNATELEAVLTQLNPGGVLFGGLVTADFNQDNRPDIAVVDAGASHVLNILLGQLPQPTVS